MHHDVIIQNTNDLKKRKKMFGQIKEKRFSFAILTTYKKYPFIN